MIFVGTDLTKLISHVQKLATFLLIDDGRISIDATLFDHTIHRFNPLRNMTYKRARDFVSIINAVFPEGENTLTRKNSSYVLLKALLTNPTTLDKLIPPSEEPAEQDAYQKIDTILLSPVLNRVLLEDGNFSFKDAAEKGPIAAVLDRTKLAEFDCRVLANLIIGQFKGQIVITDFGFYAAPHHTSLIREDRLIAQVNTLDELPKNVRDLFLLGEAIPCHCTYDDAVILARFKGLKPDPSRIDNPYNNFIDTAML